MFLARWPSHKRRRDIVMHAGVLQVVPARALNAAESIGQEFQKIA